MNVTLGIPRLQEILMTAARDIKTPVMTCPFQVGRSKYVAYKSILLVTFFLTFLEVSSYFCIGSDEW